MSTDPNSPSAEERADAQAQTPPNANSETESDVVRTQSVIVGNNPVELITETDTPESVSFVAGDGHDFHIRTQLTLYNPADTEQTETLTVSLIQGDTATGTVLASTQKSVTVGANATRTVDFNTGEFRLPDGEYLLTVEHGGNVSQPLEIRTTREYTRAASYMWGLTADGGYRLITHSGDESIRVDPETGAVAFPSGISKAAGPLETEGVTATSAVTVGRDPGQTITETGGDRDPAAVTSSDGPEELVFTAGDGVDIHRYTDVTLESSESTTTTGGLTVELQRYDAAGMTTVVSESLSVEVPPEGTTLRVLDEPVRLGESDYRIVVSTSVSSHTVYRTEEQTKGGAFTWESSSGVLSLTDANDREIVRYPELDTDLPAYPEGVATGATVYESRRGTPTTDELDVGAVMTFVSDGSGAGAGSAGDLVYAANDGGTIVTTVLGALSDAE